MSEVKKLSEEQLTELNNIIKTLKYLDSQIASMRVEESRAVDAYKKLLDQLEGQKELIRNEHGEVEVNLETGEIIKQEKEGK
jgi:hypothetical protein